MPWIAIAVVAMIGVLLVLVAILVRRTGGERRLITGLAMVAAALILTVCKLGWSIWAG